MIKFQFCQTALLPLFILAVATSHSVFEAEVALGQASPAEVHSEPAEEVLEHIRLRRAETGEVDGLKVSLTRLIGPNQQTVDLISAVHIADKNYFEDLNARFRTYEAVLYELVMTDAKSNPANINATPALQDPIAKFSGFSSQLKVVDYTAKNLVHADLSAAELKQEMLAGGSNIFTIISSLLEASSQPDLKQMSEQMNIKLLLAAISPNRTLLMKRVVAELLASSDRTFKQLGGVVSELLIVKRNQRVMEVLTSTLKTKSDGEIAIFYGAGHMDDLVTRMEKDLGFRVVKTEWLLAWDLKGD